MRSFTVLPVASSCKQAHPGCPEEVLAVWAMTCGSSLHWWAGMSAYETDCPAISRNSRHSLSGISVTMMTNSTTSFYIALAMCQALLSTFTLINEFNLHNSPREVGTIIIP